MKIYIQDIFEAIAISLFIGFGFYYVIVDSQSTGILLARLFAFFISTVLILAFKNN